MQRLIKIVRNKNTNKMPYENLELFVNSGYDSVKAGKVIGLSDHGFNYRLKTEIKDKKGIIVGGKDLSKLDTPVKIKTFCLQGGKNMEEILNLFLTKINV